MTIENRLETLEKELKGAKRLNHCWLTAAALAAVIGFVGSAHSFSDKVVRANKFILEDGSGEIRAVLGVNEKGQGLYLYDEKGKSYASLSTTEDGAALVLADKTGRNRLIMALPKGNPGLSMMDAKGKTRVLLFVNEAGSSLALNDQNGEERASLAYARNGPLLGMSDEKGNPRVILNTVRKGSSLSFRDEKGKLRAFMGLAGSDSNMFLFDKDEKTIWREPKNFKP